jgi:hypothetical protein
MLTRPEPLLTRRLLTWWKYSCAMMPLSSVQSSSVAVGMCVLPATAPLVIAVLIVMPSVWLTLTVPMLTGGTVESAPRPGAAPAALLAMITPVAPACCA